MNLSSKVHLITFGEGDGLQRSAALRLKNQAITTGWFETIRAYGIATLMKDRTWYENNKKFLHSNPRGFGYWIWKPYLIWKTLINIPTNDILLYLDAGYEINPLGKERFEQYIELVENKYIVGWQLQDQPTSFWTKADVLRYFGLANTSQILELPQRESSFHLAKNNATTRSFYRDFSLICCDSNYSLVDDTPSIDQEQLVFREHRHDQAIFSLLTYEQSIGLFPNNESYFTEQWNSGVHPSKYPFAAMRNKSGASRLESIKNVKSYVPAIYTDLENKVLAGWHWGDGI